MVDLFVTQRRKVRKECFTVLFLRKINFFSEIIRECCRLLFLPHLKRLTPGLRSRNHPSHFEKWRVGKCLRHAPRHKSIWSEGTCPLSIFHGEGWIAKQDGVRLMEVRIITLLLIAHLPISMKSIKELQELFDSKIPYESFNRQPKALYEPFSYMLQLSGKRMRPVLVLLGCEMFNTPAEEALPQAIAIELFHNFTLIHDDIMDEAPLRRGLPTVHEKFNSNTAILSGDVMFVFAYRQLLNSKPVLLNPLIALFNKTAIEVCEGQQIDMLFEKRNDVSADEYLNMIELKTAVLLGCSLEMGALVGGASTEDRPQR